MKQLTSLNRNIYSQGADEMINLEQDLNGSLKVIKDKKLLFTIDVSSNTKGVFKHNTVDADTYIIRYTSNDIEVYNMSGEILQNWEVPYEWGRIVDIKPYENSIVVSCENSYVLYYRKDGEYTLLEYSNLEPIKVGIGAEIIKLESNYARFDVGTANPSFIRNPIESVFNEFVGEYTQYWDNVVLEYKAQNALKEGYFGIVFAYKLTSGETIFSTSPMLVNCGFRNSKIIYETQATPLIATYKMALYNGYENVLIDNTFNTCSVNINLPLIDNKDIASVEIYTTRHIPLYIFDFDKVRTVDITVAPDEKTYLNDLSKYLYNDISETFGDELYYLYDTVDVANLSDVYLMEWEKFEDVTLNKTLGVDSSFYLRSNGNMFQYNKRVHYYDYKSTAKDFGGLSVYEGNGAVEFKMNAELNEKDVFIGNINTDTYSGGAFVGLNKFASIPFLSDVLKLANGSTVRATIQLTKSSYYNHSFTFNNFNPTDAYYPTVDITQENVTYDPIEKVQIQLQSTTEQISLDPTLFGDKSTLIVSTNTNPLIFDIEKVYDFDGAILNIDVATEQVSQSQIGMYPIYVFTDDGIVLLEQGSGDVLYSRQTKISNDIAISVQQVDKAVAYITDGADVKLISGSQTFDISKNALDFYLDNSIRNSVGIRQTTKNSALTQIGQFISDREFKDFVLDANMAYDTLERNLILSSNREYSYVYNMINRMWSKVDRHYSFSSFGIAGFDTQDYTAEIYDMTKDADTNKDVLYLSMPLSFENYNTIKQIGFYGNFSIPSDKVFGLYIFASNDKSNWELVNSRQFATVTPQVILPRIGRAYKYIRILLCGEVLTDFSIMGFKLNTVEKYNKRLR